VSLVCIVRVETKQTKWHLNKRRAYTNNSYTRKHVCQSASQFYQTNQRIKNQAGSQRCRARVDYFNEINGQTLLTRFQTSSKWQSLSEQTATGMQMIKRISSPSFFHLPKNSYSTKTTLKKPSTFLLASSSGLLSGIDLAVAVVRSLGLSLSAGFVLWSSSKSFCQ
jgi:hypothetical protein